jgi:hypothetical protein
MLKNKYAQILKNNFYICFINMCDRGLLHKDYNRNNNCDLIVSIVLYEKPKLLINGFK